MKQDLTNGNVIKTMLLFAGPMILGNLLQQCYNIADTLIVGRFVGPGALAAVGSAYTLMTFLTSVLIGLCMGSSSVISFYQGKKDPGRMKRSVHIAFIVIGIVTIVMNIVIFVFLDPILRLLQTPESVYEMMHQYVAIIFSGLFFVFLYNYFAFLMRSMGNSVVPLWFLGGAAFLNIGLDLLFVTAFHWGIRGAAAATVIAQILSGVGIALYVWIREPWLHPARGDMNFSKNSLFEMLRFSAAACIQQSVMNFGILMIQGLVNSFGTAVMAAFAAAVKVDSLAYMPAQEFANAYSIFISQNHGAGKKDRIQKGSLGALKVSVAFCALISVFVYQMAPWLMRIFIDAKEQEIIGIGTGYLRVEGAFYCGIGILFLLYGFFRGVEKPEMSLVLTIISLGTRVLLAYILAPIPAIGVMGIWWAIPIGWILADTAGFAAIYFMERRATHGKKICSD
ncbi:MAG: MATE family efflux transporter [Lachnospiraceae bacterium]|nr:MATE family efflux transporter [Lachnospiraceae bacterium]